MKDDQLRDSDWTAFCYVSADMTSQECEAFEKRLAQDAAACEDVARQVELINAIAVALETEPTPHRTLPAGRKKILCWAAAIGTAACIVTAVLVSLPKLMQDGQHRPASEGIAENESAMGSDLAFAWSQTLDWSADDIAENVGDAVQDDDSISDEADEGLEEITAVTTPDWMMIAVSGIMNEADSTAEPPKEM